MTQDSENELIKSLKTDKPLDAAVAEELTQEFPFFTIPASRALMADNLTEEQRKRFLAAVALNASDTASLLTLVDPDGARFANFYPDDNPSETPSTEHAIDTFLDTYGHGIDPHEQALLERLIFNPVPDYSEVLVRKAEEEAGDAVGTDEYVSEQDALLDAFLSSQSKKETHPVAETSAPHEHHPKPDPESPLSESLAKIFIKRGRYDKAFEIIKQLSLNFPEKSIYFADQLRFLQKLMLNQKYAGTKK